MASTLRLVVPLSRRLSKNRLVALVPEKFSWRGDERSHNTARSGSAFRRFSSDKPLIPGIGLGKTSTGIAGLPVDHDAVPKIIAGNQALLDKMAQSDMPETAQYRINVEAIARYRIKVCEENFDDPETVEELVECGQVEELVIQAANEMEVLDMYLESRLWEKINPNVEIEYDPDPMEDNSHLGGDEEEVKR